MADLKQRRFNLPPEPAAPAPEPSIWQKIQGLDDPLLDRTGLTEKMDASNTARGLDTSNVFEKFNREVVRTITRPSSIISALTAGAGEMLPAALHAAAGGYLTGQSVAQAADDTKSPFERLLGGAGAALGIAQGVRGASGLRVSPNERWAPKGPDLPTVRDTANTLMDANRPLSSIERDVLEGELAKPQGQRSLDSKEFRQTSKAYNALDKREAVVSQQAEKAHEAANKLVGGEQKAATVAQGKFQDEEAARQLIADSKVGTNASKPAVSESTSVKTGPTTERVTTRFKKPTQQGPKIKQIVGTPGAGMGVAAPDAVPPPNWGAFGVPLKVEVPEVGGAVADASKVGQTVDPAALAVDKSMPAELANTLPESTTPGELADPARARPINPALDDIYNKHLFGSEGPLIIKNLKPEEAKYLLTKTMGSKQIAYLKDTPIFQGLMDKAFEAGEVPGASARASGAIPVVDAAQPPAGAPSLSTEAPKLSRSESRVAELNSLKASLPPDHPALEHINNELPIRERYIKAQAAAKGLAKDTREYADYKRAGVEANIARGVTDGALATSPAVNSPNPLNLKGESGGINPILMARLGLGAGGAAIGASKGDTTGERINNALVFGALGAMAPTLLPGQNSEGLEKAVGGFGPAIKPTMNKIGDVINQIHNIGLFGPMSIAKKGLSDVGGLLLAAAEHPDKSSALRNAVFGGGLPEAWQATKAAYHAPFGQQALGIQNAPGGGALSYAGKTMAALTAGTKNLLGQAGFEPALQEYYTGTAKPQAKLFGQMLKTQRDSRFLQNVMPTMRMMVNRVESGYEHSPLGFIKSITAETPELRTAAFKKAALGTGLMEAAYKLTPEDFIKNHPVASALVPAAASVPLSIPIAIAMGLKTRNKSPWSTAVHNVSKDVPGLELAEEAGTSIPSATRNYLASYTNAFKQYADMMSKLEGKSSDPKDYAITSPDDSVANKALFNVPGIRDVVPSKPITLNGLKVRTFKIPK